VGFEGDKLTVISEFAVKTVLEKFKMAIEKGGHTPYDEAVSYRSRVYATFNHSKHTMYISYVAENSQTKEQYHVGTITYNTVLQKWMSEISDKFSMAMDLVLIQQGSMTRQEQVYGKKTSLQILLQVNLSVPDFEELIMNTGLKLY
jgi:hypothetical protein